MLGFFKLLSLEAIGYVAIGNLIIKKLWEYITLGFTIGTPSFIQSNMNYTNITLPTRSISQSCGFSSSHLWM